MATIFLSYAAADRARVQPLVTVLEAQGFDVWWDRDISLGESYHRVIEQALKRSACAIVVWSQASVTSEWVTNEASEARKRGILVPVFLDEVEPPLEFRHLQSARLVSWQGATGDANLQQLIAAVRRVVQRDVNAPTVASGQAPAAVRPARSWWETPAGWAVGASALLVAISLFMLVFRGSGATDRVIEPAEPAAGSNANPTAGVPTSAPGASGAPRTAGVPDGTINLIDVRAGALIVAANESGWKDYIFGRANPYCSVVSTNGFVTFAFRDERQARFDRLGIFVEATSGYNVKTVELYASSESDQGPFQKIGTFVVPNFRNERQPFHEFTFAPVTARYVKLVALNWQEGAGPNGNVCTMQLMGMLQ
jgi:hypothetical protein